MEFFINPVEYGNRGPNNRGTPVPHLLHYFPIFKAHCEISDLGSWGIASLHKSPNDGVTYWRTFLK